MREDNEDRVLSRFTGEGGVDAIAPELITHATNGRIGGGIGDAGEFNVESANGKVGCSGGRWDEGLEGIGRGIIFPEVSKRTQSERGALIRAKVGALYVRQGNLQDKI